MHIAVTHERVIRVTSASCAISSATSTRGGQRSCGGCKSAAKGIGRILAAFERKGIRDDTWVIYTSDHGEMLGDHELMGKACFYRASVRVPLIVSPAASARAAQRADRGIAQLVDVGATVLDIAAEGLTDQVTGGCGVNARHGASGEYV